jgi:hypothetical protein
VAPSSASRPSCWLLLPVSVALVYAAALYPGRWTSDTVYQELETAGVVGMSDWYSPLLNTLLSAPYRLVPHFGLLLVLQLLVLAVSVYGVGRALFSARGAALLAVGCLVYAPILGWAIVLSRDVWYGTALLGGAAALRLVLFARLGTVGSIFAWLAAALALALAMAIRQNGIVGVLPLVAFAAWVLLGRSDNPRFTSLLSSTRRRLLATGAATLFVLGATTLALRAIVYEGVDARRANIDAVLYTYDLAAVSQRLNENRFSRSVLPPERFPQLVEQFDPANVDSVFWGEDELFDLSRPGSVAALRDDWVETLSERPATYVAARAHLFGELVAASAPPVWTYHPTTESRKLEDPRLRADIADPAFERPNVAVDRYLAVWADSFLQRPVLYLAAILAFLALSVRRDARYRFVASVGAGVVLYVGSFFFLATGVGNRFSWVAMVLGVVAMAALAASARTWFVEVAGRREARSRVDGRPWHDPS